MLKFLHWHRYQDAELDGAIDDLVEERRKLSDEEFTQRLELVLERFERHGTRMRMQSFNSRPQRTGLNGDT